MHSFWSQTRALRPCALNIQFHGHISQKTLLEVLLPGLVSLHANLVQRDRPDADPPFLEEHVIAVREEPKLHLEFYQPYVPIECGHPETPVDAVSKSFQETVKVPQNLENTVQLVDFVFPCMSPRTGSDFPSFLIFFGVA